MQKHILAKRKVYDSNIRSNFDFIF
jgi:hypothetical protein